MLKKILNRVLLSLSIATITMAVWQSALARQGAQGEREVYELKSGTPVERELKGGEVHSYKIQIAQGQYARVEVDQRGIDVWLRLIGSDDREVVVWNLEPWKQGQESVSVLAEASEEYHLEVHTQHKTASVGQYEIRIVELREATASDRNRVAAERAFVEASRLSQERTRESRQKAIQKYEEALRLWQAVDDRRWQALTFQRIGIIYGILGDLQKGLDYNVQTLTLRRVLGDHRWEVQLLSNIGGSYSQLGDPDRALDYYLQSLQTAQALGDAELELSALNRVGTSYTRRGEYQKALDFLNRELSLARATRSPVEGSVLFNIGTAYFRLDEYQKALDAFDQALLQHRDKGNRFGEIRTLDWVGSVYDALGEHQKALETHSKALLLSRSAGYRGEEANALVSIGRVYARTGEYQKARDYLKQALAIRQALGNPQDVIPVLLRFAIMERDRENLTEARIHIEEALRIIESMRAQVGSEEQRASFLASKQNYYELYIDLLMRQHQSQPSGGYDAMALEASQRSRARALLELLAESRIDIRQDLTPEQRKREDSLFNRISTIQKKLWKEGLPAEDERLLKKELATAEDDLEGFRLEVRRASPRYASIQYPEPLKLDRIQREMIVRDSALIEYVLGEKRSFAWLITQNSLAVAVLPPRKEIEQQVTEYRKALAEKVSALTLNQALARFNSQSQQLYRSLVQPLEKNLSAVRRLIIIPDGVLAYLPFETLVSNIDSRKNSRHLLERFSISYAPSASALAAIKAAGRQSAAHSKMLIAFGDPIYETGGNADERSVSIKDVNSAFKFYAERGFDFNRLPYTRDEVVGIGSIFSGARRQIYLGAQAIEQTVKSEKLDEYRYVHFAAHGLIDEQRPARSGIVLSINGEAKEDGVLQMSEIMRLKLNADLVTLSACRTGLGKLLSGEGIIGLTRAFFYAGTSSIVVSLWNVNDLATAELMKAFYRNINKGMAKDEALRQAKLGLIKGQQRAWQHPYFWAPFILVGDSK